MATYKETPQWGSPARPIVDFSCIDPFAITVVDPDHSDEEERYLDVGLSVKERLLVVWYAEREENIRIIGCRRTTPFERKTYEEREERF